MVKERNNSIDIFRLISSIMVVMIHTKPLSDINAELGFVLSDIIPRIAVPYFFAVSGYYYYKKICNSTNALNTLFNQLYSLLKQYVFWSLIYFSINLIDIF